VHAAVVLAEGQLLKSFVAEEWYAVSGEQQPPTL